MTTFYFKLVLIIVAMLQRWVNVVKTAMFLRGISREELQIKSSQYNFKLHTLLLYWIRHLYVLC